MFWAGLGIILVFGFIKISDVFTENYLPIAEYFSEGRVDYKELKRLSETSKAHILLYDNAQRLLFATDSSLAEYGNIRLINIVKTEQDFFIAVSKRIVSSGEILQGIIYIDILAEIRELLNLSKILFYVYIVVIFFTVLAMAGSGKKVFQPIKDMTETVKGISENNMNLRLNVSGSKDELKDLAITFNEMMNRIEEDYNRKKQFVSDASHELRTPIAVIQGYVDMLNRWGKNDEEVLQEAIEAIKNESENMKDLVDKLLFLARNDKGTLTLQKEEFSLTEMLTETVKETQIIDDSHIISYNIKEEISLFADRKRIKQAVRILIDNAIKYTPQKGEITINLKTERGYASVSVRDTGIGMSKEPRSVANNFGQKKVL